MDKSAGATNMGADRYAYVHVWIGSVPSKEDLWDYLEQDAVPEGTYSKFMNDIGEAARYDDDILVFGGCMCEQSHPVAELFDDTIVDAVDHPALLRRCEQLGVNLANAFICYQDPDLNPPERDYLGLRYMGQFKMQRIPKTRQY